MKEDLRAFYSIFFLFGVGKQKDWLKTEMSMRLGSSSRAMLIYQINQYFLFLNCRLLYLMYILHSFWNLDAEQRHTILQDLCHVGCKNQTGNLLCLALSIQDAVVVIELVELLGQPRSSS